VTCHPQPKCAWTGRKCDRCGRKTAAWPPDSETAILPRWKNGRQPLGLGMVPAWIKLQSCSDERGSEEHAAGRSRHEDGQDERSEMAHDILRQTFGAGCPEVLDANWADGGYFAIAKKSSCVAGFATNHSSICKEYINCTILEEVRARLR